MDNRSAISAGERQAFGDGRDCIREVDQSGVFCTKIPASRDIAHAPAEIRSLWPSAVLLGVPGALHLGDRGGLVPGTE